VKYGLHYMMVIFDVAVRDTACYDRTQTWDSL